MSLLVSASIFVAKLFDFRLVAVIKELPDDSTGYVAADVLSVLVLQLGGCSLSFSGSVEDSGFVGVVLN